MDQEHFYTIGATFNQLCSSKVFSETSLNGCQQND